MNFLKYINEEREMVKQWNDYIKTNKDLSIAVDILKKINKAGYKAYIVGGFIRDVIIGNIDKKSDIDIATNCPPEILSKLYKLYPVGKSGDFGIWIIRQGGVEFEVAQFRGESYDRPKYVRRILK